MSREDKLYNQLFGKIPNDLDERIKYIMGKRIDNKRLKDDINKSISKIRRIKKKKIEFVLYKIVKPSARPRVNTRMGYPKIYVPGAAEAGDWFEKFAKENKLPVINTPCTLEVEIYEKTPSSYSIKNKILAELGYHRPWKRTGDFDNYAKTIADMIQHGMLTDDCLIVDAKQSLYYSIKPRAKVILTYLEKFPEM